MFSRNHHPQRVDVLGLELVSWTEVVTKFRPTIFVAWDRETNLNLVLIR